jgi:hypothetical protein
MADIPQRHDLRLHPHPGWLLNRRYFLALAILVLLLLMNQLLVQPSLMQLMVDAPTINIAGRQRMYSQRIAKAALTLDRAADRAERNRRVAELKEVARLWTEAHETLQAGLASPSLFSRPSRRLLQKFAAIEPSYAILKSSIASLIESASGPELDRTSAQISLSHILEHENDYQQSGSRVEPAARSHRELYRGLPGNARDAATGRGRGSLGPSADFGPVLFWALLRLASRFSGLIMARSQFV